MTNKNIPPIAVNDISYVINGNIVLENLTFQIQQGDYVGILGPNGSGKTTLLKIILGLLEPTSGEVELFGEAQRTFNKRHLIGYVPQRASRTDWAFPATVEEVVWSGRTPAIGPFKRLQDSDRAAADKAMELLELDGLRKRNINQLSGGERQRVFIARALAAEPKVLILDEPTTGVDISVQHQFYGFLKKLNKEDITIVMVSHDIDAITHETDYVLCINRKMVCNLPTKEFLKEDHMSLLFGADATHIFHDHDEEKKDEHNH